MAVVLSKEHNMGNGNGTPALFCSVQSVLLRIFMLLCFNLHSIVIA